MEKERILIRRFVKLLLCLLGFLDIAGFFVSEVHGIGFLHDFLFLNTSVQFGGLMMDSEVFFHYLSILH
jgi:hypothetical protein